MQINEKQLKSLAEMINEYFEGNPANAAQDLEQVIYMLHHLDSEIFEKKDIQNVAFAMKKLSEGLRGK